MADDDRIPGQPSSASRYPALTVGLEDLARAHTAGTAQWTYFEPVPGNSRDASSWIRIPKVQDYVFLWVDNLPHGDFAQPRELDYSHVYGVGVKVASWDSATSHLLGDEPRLVCQRSPIVRAVAS